MWIARLNNGQVVEQQGDIPGEESFWRKFLTRCEDEDLYVESLKIVTDNGVSVSGLANADGYCAVYEAHVSFVSTRSSVQVRRVYQGVGSVFGDLVFLSFVGEDDSVMSDVRPLDSMIMHCQLKPAGARRRRDKRPLLVDFDTYFPDD